MTTIALFFKIRFGRYAPTNDRYFEALITMMAIVAATRFTAGDLLTAGIGLIALVAYARTNAEWDYVNSPLVLTTKTQKFLYYPLSLIPWSLVLVFTIALARSGHWWWTPALLAPIVWVVPLRTALNRPQRFDNTLQRPRFDETSRAFSSALALDYRRRVNDRFRRLIMPFVVNNIIIAALCVLILESAARLTRHDSSTQINLTARGVVCAVIIGMIANLMLFVANCPHEDRALAFIFPNASTRTLLGRNLYLLSAVALAIPAVLLSTRISGALMVIAGIALIASVARFLPCSLPDTRAKTRFAHIVREPSLVAFSLLATATIAYFATAAVISAGILTDIR